MCMMNLKTKTDFLKYFIMNMEPLENDYHNNNKISICFLLHNSYLSIFKLIFHDLVTNVRAYLL